MAEPGRGDQLRLIGVGGLEPMRLCDRCGGVVLVVDEQDRWRDLLAAVCGVESLPDLGGVREQVLLDAAAQILFEQVVEAEPTAEFVEQVPEVADAGDGDQTRGVQRSAQSQESRQDAEGVRDRRVERTVSGLQQPNRFPVLQDRGGSTTGVAVPRGVEADRAEPRGLEAGYESREPRGARLPSVHQQDRPRTVSPPVGHDPSAVH